MRSKLGNASAIASLVLFPWIYYLPVTLGRLVFAEGDINWGYSPIRTELARALAQGRLPLWSPGLQAGFPLFAEGQVAALYPLNLIAYRLFPVYVANSYTVLFHFSFASLGLYLLVRSAGMQMVSAWLAGFVFGLSGFMAAQLSHLTIVAAASWLPWLFLFQLKYWRSCLEGNRTIVWFALASLSICFVVLAGFPQVAVVNLGMYGLGGLLGPVLWSGPAAFSGNSIAQQRSLLTRAFVVTLSSILLGVGLAAIQLLPTFELLGLSVRSQEMGEVFFASYSLNPASLTQFFFPFWQLGAPSAANMEYWGYIGVFPLLLALFAVLHRRDAQTLFFAFVALTAIALALGDNTPLYHWLYQVPVLNRFRVPARFLFPFTLAIAYLAALGIETLIPRLPALSWNWKDIAVGAILALLVAAMIFEAYAQPIEVWIRVWQYLPFVFIIVSMGWILLAWSHRALGRLHALAALGLIILDLTAARGPFLQALTGLASPEEWTLAPRSSQSMDSAQPIYRVIAEKPPWTSAAARGSLWANLALVYGKQGVKSYVPTLGLQRNQTFLDQMTTSMRNLMNIRYYLLPVELPDLGGPEPSPFDRSEPNGGLTIDLLSQQPAIPPTNVSILELTSYTDQTCDLANGLSVGEILLGTSRGEVMSFPIRLGFETADWAWDASASSGNCKHQASVQRLDFPAYLKAIGQTFNGHRYVARYVVAPTSSPLSVTSVGIQSFLAGSGLTVEHVALIDHVGNSTSLSRLVNRNDLTLAFRSHTTVMWENRDLMPRTFIVHQAETLPDKEVVSLLKEPDFPYDRVVLLAEGPQALLPAETETMGTDEAVITDYDPESVSIQAETDRDGYLVLTDTWYPGWTVSLDGQAAPIYRADYIFRAVKLPPGKHTLLFRYQPASLMWGAVISVFTLVFGAIAVFVFAKRPRGL